MTQKFRKHQYFIADLINEHDFKVIAEIGIYNGTMTECLLKECANIDEYWAIDQWCPLSEKHDKLSKLTDKDWFDKYYKVCKLSVDYTLLKVLKMDSITSSKLFPDKYFDLVFIDASHFYEDTKLDIITWLPKVRERGILSGHDYGRGGQRGFGVQEAVDEIFGPEEIEVLGKSTWIRKIKG